MKVRVSRRLPGVCFAAAMVFAPLAASAQNAPMMGGGHDHHMMGGGMMGGDMDPMAHMMGMMERMSHMMAMMHDKLAHAGDRIASLKTELKITEAQTPAWNKFADALVAAAKSADESMEIS
jgi:hypothetical protein